MVETTVVTVGLEQVIDNKLDDNVATGIAVLVVTATVFCVKDEAQPDVVFVTTTVEMPLPLATGFEIVLLFKDPLPGAVQLYVTPADGVELATMVTVGFVHVVVTDGAAIFTIGNTVFDATVIFAFPVQPLIVLVITTEYVPP